MAGFRGCINVWQKFLVFAFKCISYVAARFIYSPLSRFIRFFFERKYKRLPTDTPWTILKVIRFYQTCKWVSDPVGGLLDFISKPEKFYATKQGDCDDFAAFADEVLDKNSYLVSATWFDPLGKSFRKKFNGHVVCAFTNEENKWFHIGNQGLMGPFEEFEDLVYSIPPPGIIPCTYSSRTGDLKYIAGGWL